MQTGTKVTEGQPAEGRCRRSTVVLAAAKRREILGLREPTAAAIIIQAEVGGGCENVARNVCARAACSARNEPRAFGVSRTAVLEHAFHRRYFSSIRTFSRTKRSFSLAFTLSVC